MPDAFINPYNFVRTAGQPPHRQSPPTQEKFAGHSGRIVCRFETLSPLCVPDAEATDEVCISWGRHKKKMRNCIHLSSLVVSSSAGNRVKTAWVPYVAGSSLKGMLRSVAEAASNSCLSVFPRSDEEQVERKRRRFAIFRDNRSHALRRGLGRLDVRSEQDWLVDPCPGQDMRSLSPVDRGLFGRTNDASIGAATPRPGPAGLVIPPHVRQHYLDMVADEGFLLGPEPGSDTDPEPPNEQERAWLKDFSQDSLWWYRVDPEQQDEIIEIGRNFRYKWAYDPRLAAGNDYLPCPDVEHLCPCCSLFGMVREKESEHEVNAISGRVSIGPARWIGGKNALLTVDDPKILSTPKSSCRSFYLQPSTTKGNVSRDEFTIRTTDAVEPTPLRGRKFYWHHAVRAGQNRSASGWREYLSRLFKEDGQPPHPTNQSAVLETLLPGAIFEFTIDFENLSSFELGLLLWSIALPDAQNNAGAHHLGLGKPIGLGSIRVAIHEVVLINRATRYNSLQETGYGEPITKGLEDPILAGFVNLFKSEMARICRQSDFLNLPNIADLCVILSTDQPHSAIEITYPPGPPPNPGRKKKKPDDDPRFVPHYRELHYNWFGPDGTKWSQPLRTIQQIAAGEYQSTVDL
jgi:hypothetical protein